MIDKKSFRNKRSSNFLCWLWWYKSVYLDGVYLLNKSCFTGYLHAEGNNGFTRLIRCW